MDDWGVASALCLSLDGLAAGSLSCRDLAGETPACPTGKMPVLP
jgi:hypothetical protein